MNLPSNPLLNKSFTELEIVCFDIEATGLRKATARIVEIAAVKIRAAEILEDTFESLCRPDYPIPPGAIRIHHITDDDVAGAPETHEVVTRFFEWAGDDCLFAAHNAHYDVEVLARNAMRAGVSDTQRVMALDTLGWSRRWLEARNYKLGTLARELEIEPEGDLHRALCDARLLAGIAASMIDGFGVEKTPSDLLKLISPEALVLPPEFSTATPELPSRLQPITDALAGGNQVRIKVADRRKGDYAAIVRPLFLLFDGDTPLMEAWSEKLGEVRNYPLDRVIAAEELA